MARVTVFLFWKARVAFLIYFLFSHTRFSLTIALNMANPWKYLVASGNIAFNFIVGFTYALNLDMYMDCTVLTLYTKEKKNTETWDILD